MSQLKSCTFGIEFTLSKLNSLYVKDQNENPISLFTYKLFDDQDAEITEAVNEGNAVKTVIDFMPAFDYGFTSGNFFVKTDLTQDVRVWMIIVPDVPAPTGSFEALTSVNLRYIKSGSPWHADAAAKALLKYNSGFPPANKIRALFRHAAGFQHDFMTTIQVLKKG